VAISSVTKSSQHIRIEGARVHNLKNITVEIPRNCLVVITGLSGSGKSSLAFDTLYAEGQRRYVESLSSYARQFLGRLDKPEVDHIRGIAPAIAIDQKVSIRSSRSTVGTSTEIYDYLKLFYARAGKTFSPISGKEVKRETAADVRDLVIGMEEGKRIYVLAPLLPRKDRSVERQLEILSQQGYTRVQHKNELYRIGEIPAELLKKAKDWNILIDRLAVQKNDDEFLARLSDSAESAFSEGNGTCIIQLSDEPGTTWQFSNRFELDGMVFEEPSVNFFSFNNPIGACKRCEGFGSVIGIDENLVIPEKSLSVYQDAVSCWKGEVMSEWKDNFIVRAGKKGFPIHRPYSELSPQERDFLWKGDSQVEGINDFFSHLEQKSYKIQYRVMLSRYRGKTLCPDCRGTRLRKDASYVTIGGKSIIDLVLMSIQSLRDFFAELKLSKSQQEIAKRVLTEINNRLKYLDDVGLGYLTLNRLSNSLSGGESQRINLATSLGSSLVGSMYILDEPSIGLHPRDTQRLIGVLRSLQKLGNTVIVVEHDEEIMRAADYIIDLGPLAGSQGGEIVFTGTFSELPQGKNSLTAAYLTGKMEVPVPGKRRKWKDRLILKGLRENNLKNVTVEIPLRVLTAVTGVSGSGKSTLVSDILYPALRRHLGEYSEKTAAFDKLEGDLKTVKVVEFVDQNPIGRSSRSNPVSYLKAFDEIRQLLANQQLAMSRGYKAGHFSFNIAGGRCDNCEGEGEVSIEMQFMADIRLQCEVCKGRKFKEEVLEIAYREKNVYEILELTVDDAIGFFAADEKNTLAKKVVHKLMALREVGLGYVKLGQSSSTLSGGEAQRIKLASFLTAGNNELHTVFIFDEPTTGLHFHDVNKLMDAFNALLSSGHTVVVIEHDLDVIKCADWIIDLGPEGGDAGGNIVFTGTPEELILEKASYTGKYLREKLGTK